MAAHSVPGRHNNAWVSRNTDRHRRGLQDAPRYAGWTHHYGNKSKTNFMRYISLYSVKNSTKEDKMKYIFQT